jgi:hypothetical protein
MRSLSSIAGASSSGTSWLTQGSPRRRQLVQTRLGDDASEHRTFRRLQAQQLRVPFRIFLRWSGFSESSDKTSGLIEFRGVCTSMVGNLPRLVKLHCLRRRVACGCSVEQQYVGRMLKAFAEAFRRGLPPRLGRGEAGVTLCNTIEYLLLQRFR